MTISVIIMYPKYTSKGFVIIDASDMIGLISPKIDLFVLQAISGIDKYSSLISVLKFIILVLCLVSLSSSVRFYI